MTYLTEILQFSKCSKKENSFIASKRSKFSAIHSGSFLETMKEFHFSRIFLNSKRNLNEFPKESEQILEQKNKFFFSLNLYELQLFWCNWIKMFLAE